MAAHSKVILYQYFSQSTIKKYKGDPFADRYAFLIPSTSCRYSNIDDETRQLANRPVTLRLFRTLRIALSVGSLCDRRTSNGHVTVVIAL